MPPLPRLIVNNIVLLPLVDDQWLPVQDTWVLPGGEVRTTEQILALARVRGWTHQLIS